MTTSRLGAAVALILVAFTAACDDGGTGPSFPDSVSTADANEFADGVANYADQVAYGINFNGPTIGLAAPAMATRIQAALPPQTSGFRGVSFTAPDLSLLDRHLAVSRVQAVQASSSAGCTVTARGWVDPSFEEPVDLNGNGIPDDAYLKYVCSTSDSIATDTVVTEVVSVEFAWKEITSSLYGQTVLYNIEQNAHDNHGRYQLIRYHITGKQDIRSSGIVDQAAFRIRQESNLSGDVQFFEAGESWDNGFTPSGSINPEVGLPNGALTISGNRYTINSEGEGASFGISTPTPLAYSSVCYAADTNPPFTGGVLLGRLNNNSHQASFEVTFTSCGNYTIAVDGAFDEVAAAGSFRP